MWCSITELGLNEDEARRFNAARGFVCGAAEPQESSDFRVSCFNAARGFVCGAAGIAYMLFALSNVSMPHAALCVVQLRRSQPLSP